MKKLLFILAIALLTACSSTYEMTSSVVSFEKYNKAGFLITTSSIGTTYQSLGMVSINCQTGVDPGGAINQRPMFSKAIYHDCDQDGMVSELYKQAIKLNANAIIDLKFYNYLTKTGFIHSVTGLAVKI